MSRLLPMFSGGDLNPLKWLGDAAAEAVGQTWTAAMVAAWSSGLWILDLAFNAIDALTSPDLSANGPMREIYPYTFGLGLVVALVMAFAQIGMAAFKRDGQSIARVIIGVAQFAAVWLGYVGVAAALVTAASGLTQGLLQALVGVDGFAGYQPQNSWPRDITDTTTATVLGICAWLLIWPAAIGYLLVMLVREAALLLLVATSPIAAGGLMSEMGRTWFWRSLRWFFAAILIAPLAALVLGVGVRIASGVISGAGNDTAAAVGMAVVSCVLILVGAICPLVLFRLLAFVEPGSSSGAAMRTALASSGGIGGVLTGGTAAGSSAGQSDGQGRSAGESSADSTTSSRFAMAGGVFAGVGKAAQSAVSVGSDVMSAAGIGHQHPYYPQYAQERSRPFSHTTQSTSEFDERDDVPDGPAAPDERGTGASAARPPVTPPVDPASGASATGPAAGSASPAAADGSGAAAAAGGSSAAAAAAL